LDGVERQVPNPISRLTQALWLNQPIGVLGTGGQTPLEAQRLNENVALTAPNYNIFKNLANYSFINT
jgi:enamine deaminase RidA (YjgF/YER057c/UK114 family)